MEKVKDELTEESKPDKGRIRKWLEKAKTCFENLKLVNEVYGKAKEVYDAFNLSDLISNIPSMPT
ncbi:hypothetical protein DCC62_00950 [candidate division KSB1 bacterium]|nr:MAG: hypothetical protein DCC62_00950 [candidate division KSB1 bacterium]